MSKKEVGPATKKKKAGSKAAKSTPTPRQFVTAVRRMIRDKKGGNVVVMDLKQWDYVSDYFVVTTANTPAHSKAICNEVIKQTKEQFGRKPYSVEGAHVSGWVLVDFSHTIVHILSEELREYYKLEELWQDNSSYGVGAGLASARTKISDIT